MMLRGERAEAAVELGLRIVDEVQKRPRFPIVRVGIHTGPATPRSGDWFGTTVNIGVGSLTFRGIEYRFCSFECVRAFSDSPEKYAREG